MTEWKKVHGTQKEKPEEIDITSSPTHVYERRKIKAWTDEQSEASGWEYEEREFTKNEYIVYQSSRMVSKEDNLINQSALADLYDLILEAGGLE